MSDNWVEEVFQLVGRATAQGACWDDSGVFKEQEAISIADRLCEIVREQREARVEEKEDRLRVST